MLSLILLVFAFVLFLIAGFMAVQEAWKSRLDICLGFACWVASEHRGCTVKIAAPPATEYGEWRNKKEWVR